MKTLIFNGSPRPDGDTVSLLWMLTGDTNQKANLRNRNRPKITYSGRTEKKTDSDSAEKKTDSGKTCGIIGDLGNKGLLTGEYRLINAYCADIAPCADCRWCWSHEGCKINDGMQEIYEYMKECDNILIASPIHFSELSGKLLALLSRLQAIYCARTFQNTELLAKPKRGAILLVGGGDGRPDRACTTARILLHTMHCSEILEPVISHETNFRPAAEDEETRQGMERIAEYFNAESEFAATKS